MRVHEFRAKGLRAVREITAGEATGSYKEEGEKTEVQGYQVHFPRMNTATTTRIVITMALPVPADPSSLDTSWGVRLHPQCLHFRASMRTNSRQSGQRT